MKAYLLTLITAAFAVTLVSLLSPKGEGDGIAKHLKLLTSLFLICILISPLKSAAEGIRSLMNGEFEFSWSENGDAPDYREEMQEAVDGVSKQYFTEMLTQTLEQHFTIATGDVRCAVRWSESDGAAAPTHVTVVLSGQAIWKSPREIEALVSELLGCTCTVAIE